MAKVTLVIAQDKRVDSPKYWSLQQSIHYAIEHNISIKQSEVNARLAQLNLKQSKWGMLPSLNASPSYGISKGRSIDPTSNQFVVGSYEFVGANASSDVLLFGWFQQYHNIKNNQAAYKASLMDLEQLQQDVSLNVATGFLRALLAKEQWDISINQVNLSLAQLAQTKKFAQVGRVPELNVAQLEAQVASDSASMISAYSDYSAAILDIKALLNLDFETSYIPQAPQINAFELLQLENDNPDIIFNTAKAHRAALKSAQLKTSAAQYAMKASRAALLPQLRIGGQLGSNWTSTYKQVKGYGASVDMPTGAYVTVAGTQLDVYQKYNVPLFETPSFFTQLENNFRQTFNASLSIPIFNGWQRQSQYQQSKLNILNQELAYTQTELKLRQEVYKAHNDAHNAVQKYQAAIRNYDAAKRAFDFAQKRYELGLTNTIEYLSTQNNLFKASANQVSTKYDLIFKLKVIDYYLGKPLNL